MEVWITCWWPRGLLGFPNHQLSLTLYLSLYVNVIQVIVFVCFTVFVFGFIFIRTYCDQSLNHLLMTTRSLGISHSSRVRTDMGVRRPKALIRSSVALIFISYLFVFVFLCFSSFLYFLSSFLLFQNGPSSSHHTYNGVCQEKGIDSIGGQPQYRISRGFTKYLTGSPFSDQENKGEKYQSLDNLKCQTFKFLVHTHQSHILAFSARREALKKCLEWHKEL